MPDQTAPDDLVREMDREYWDDIPVVAYLWKVPTNFPPPSSQTMPKIAYHWSSGPQDAERLIRLSDAATRIKELTAEVERAEKHRNDLADKNVDLRIEIGALKRRATKTEEALRKCRHQFAFYAEEHRKAGKDAKAATNQHFADICSEALGEGKA